MRHPIREDIFPRDIRVVDGHMLVVIMEVKREYAAMVSCSEHM
jgi:hypothetical protein